MDYFTHHEIPSILTQNDLMFNGALVNKLSGLFTNAQYAQASFGEVALYQLEKCLVLLEMHKQKE